MSKAQPYPVVFLNDIAEKIDYGFTASAKQSGYDSKYLRITDIQDDNVDWQTVPFCDCREDDKSRYSLKNGDIVFARTGATTGKSFLVRNCPENVVFASYLIRVRPSSRVESSYLARFFQTPNYWQQITKSSTGTAQAGVNASNLKKLSVPLPPLEEQRRIAAILDRADAVRRKRKEAIALTEELLRSQFLDMFGDPVTNPKGWEVVTVGDIVSDVRDGPHVSPEYSETGIPILSTRNIRPGRLIMEDVKYISDDTYYKLVKQFQPQKGDVLLTKGGTTGFAKAVDWNWKFAIWVHLAALRPKSIILSEFLEASLNSPSCYQQSLRFTHGIANKDLGLTRLRKIKLCLPPLKLQEEYCCFRENIYRQLGNQENFLNESQTLFNSLLHRAFRGEL